MAQNSNQVSDTVFLFFVGVYFYLQPFNSLVSFFYSSEHKIVAVLENNTKNKLWKVN